jgi:hypothetical protein
MWIGTSVSIWCDHLVTFDVSGEYAGHGQLPGIVYSSLRHGAVNYHVET